MKTPLPLLGALGLAACATATPSEPPGRIVGGEDVTAGEAPYQVEITFSDFADPHWQSKNHPNRPMTEVDDHVCGGVLIAPEWVLTAAHCIVGADGAVLDKDILRVRAGSISLSVKGNPGMRVFTIDWMGPAPNYKPPVPEGGVQNPPQHDLALLHISPPTPADDPANIMPITWPRADPGPIRGVTVTGWGATEELSTQRAMAHVEKHTLLQKSATLQYVNLNEVANEVPWDESKPQTCRTKLDHQVRRALGRRASMGSLPDDLFCAEDARSDDPNFKPAAGQALKGDCFGDSGGPVVARGHLHNGGGARNDLLIGIVGWTVGCGVAPGVYTKVSSDSTWIDKTVSDWATRGSAGGG